VDLWELCEHVETPIWDLRSSGYLNESDQVQIAMRGGATRGEIPGGNRPARPGLRPDPILAR
jgi:hypothetical protein